jgi:hypothetical protein
MNTNPTFNHQHEPAAEPLPVPPKPSPDDHLEAMFDELSELGEDRS